MIKRNAFFRVGLFGILCIVAKLGMSQNQNVWVFGQKAGVDFNTNPPSSFVSGMRILEGCASVADENGALLFYTDGTYIWNKNHDTMPNGRNINPIAQFEWSGEFVPSTFSTTQAAVIVPRPKNAQQYYVFSLTAWDNWENGGKIYYSLVDMTLNGGLGDVVAGTKAVFLDSLLTERMSAVKGLQCNAWLTSVSQDLKFKSYEITENGVVHQPVVSPVVEGDTGMSNGCLVFSPDGTKLAIVQEVGARYNALFNFDAATGYVSNPLELFPRNTAEAYGACFSPDNSKLYISVTRDSIFQFDLSSGDAAQIIASKKGVVEYKSTAFQRGPDGKIYMIGAADRVSPTLSAIPQPNLTAPACGFERDVLPLTRGTSGLIGLPNDVPNVNEKSITNHIIKRPCYQNDSVNLIAVDTTGWDYKWNNGLAQHTLRTNRSGTYWVSYYTAPCVFHVDTFHIAYAFPENGLPNIQSTPSCTNTANGKIIAAPITIPGLNYTYTWLDGSMDTLATGETVVDIPSGDYWLHIYLAPGCDTLISVTVNGEIYTVDFTSDTLVCEDNELLFDNNSDAHFTEWLWDFDDGHTAVSFSPKHRFATSGNYKVRLIGVGSICSDTVYKNIVVDPYPEKVLFLKDRGEICTGEKVVFTPVSDTNTATLHWDFGDQRKFIEPNVTAISHAYDNTGKYGVELKAVFRICPEILYIDSVFVHPSPLIHLGADTALCLGDAPLVLKNSYAHEIGNRYLWSTGDTTSAIRADRPGKYRLEVSNIFGCTSMETVIVENDCFVKIPNAFTPNGDGVNDYFLPRKWLSNGLTEFHLQIFSRWGQLIFETKNIEGLGWDGKWNGKEQPMDVYLYRISVTFKNGVQEHYEGNVTLVR